MKKSNKEIKVLLVHNFLASFVKNDINLLEKNFDLSVFDWNSEKNFIIKIIKIMMIISKVDIVYCWFAWSYSGFVIFLCRLLRKKSIIIAGGGDVGYAPEINYGQFIIKGYKIKLTKYALKNADMILPVSNFTKNELLDKVKPKNYRVVYNGVDVKKYPPKFDKQKDLVVLVGGLKESNLKRKGIITFVKAAKYLPDIRFVVIGKHYGDSVEKLRSIASKNVEFPGRVSSEKLLWYYQNAKVVCLLSFYEAFGLSAAEGMLCGCIPVVTSDRTGIPEFVGDCGFYVSYGDEKQTADAVGKAIKSTKKDYEKCHKMIVENFSLEKREKRLVKVIRRMLDKK